MTGGFGYIGNAICYALKDAGYIPIILDENRSVADERGVDFINYIGDISDFLVLENIFSEHPDVKMVIHCAAKIDVAESTRNPLFYYENNFSKSIRMVQFLASKGVHEIILSSTASLYGGESAYAFDENTPPNPQSPYARSKLFLELALNDMAIRGNFKFLSLRYFNPIGADPFFRTGFIGSNKSSLLNSLILSSSQGKRFSVFGTDWPTRDGSTMRDFVDVYDLALAHVSAVDRLKSINFDVIQNFQGLPVINLGSESGVTVKEFLDSYVKVCGGVLDVVYEGRRSGDIIGGYAVSTLAKKELGWSPLMNLEVSIYNSMRWALERW